MGVAARAVGAPAPSVDLPRTTGAFDRPFQAATYLFVAVVVLAPIVPIVVQSFASKPLYDVTRVWTFGEYAELLQDPAFWIRSRSEFRKVDPGHLRL